MRRSGRVRVKALEEPVEEPVRISLSVEIANGNPVSHCSPIPPGNDETTSTWLLVANGPRICHGANIRLYSASLRQQGHYWPGQPEPVS